jgi:hypothetical protein
MNNTLKPAITAITNTPEQQALSDELFGSPVPVSQPVPSTVIQEVKDLVDNFGPKPLNIQLSTSVISRKPITDEKVIREYFNRSYSLGDIFFLDQDYLVDAAIKWADTHTDGDKEKLQNLSGPALLNEIEETLPLKFMYQVKDDFFSDNFEDICIEFNSPKIPQAA